MRTNRTKGLVFVLLLAVGGMTTAGCGDHYLRSEKIYPDDPGFNIAKDAEIEDTTANRQVLDVLSRYRRAIIDKDFGTLNRLISPSYYDNSGTTDTTKDDYDQSRLAALFEQVAQHTDNIEYKVLVKDVEVSKDRAWIDYEYDYSYQYKFGDEIAWDAGVEVNRLELIQESGKWRIVSGL